MRKDAVWTMAFSPAWHLLMQARVYQSGAQLLPGKEDAHSGSFVKARGAFYVGMQVEAGSLCPITMTFAATPLLQITRAVSGLDHAAADDRYDSHLLPGGQKRGLLIGMGTWKQGGSDVYEQAPPAQSVWTMVLIGWWGINGFLGAAKRCASGAGTDRGRFVRFFVPRFCLTATQRDSPRAAEDKLVIALTPAAK